MISPMPRRATLSALLAACLTLSARADERGGWVEPEPLGPRARMLESALLGAGDPAAMRGLLGELERQPDGQRVAVLEDLVRRGGQPLQAVVLAQLHADPGMPVSRGLADAVLGLLAAWPEGQLPAWSLAVRRFDAPEVNTFLLARLAEAGLGEPRRLACLAGLGEGAAGCAALLSAFDGRAVPADDPLAAALRRSAGARLSELLVLTGPPTSPQLAELRAAAGRGDEAALRLLLGQRARTALLQREGALALEVARIRDLERQLYPLNPPAQRSAQLARLLGEEDAGLRLLALELLDGDLQTRGPEVATEPVRQALRGTLEVAHPELRARVAQTLWVLDDAPGALIAARRLAAGGETSVAAKAGLARLVSRAPAADAGPALIALLDEPAAREAAVDALRAASDRKVLRPEDAARLVGRLKALAAERLEPRLLLLLGRVLPEGDAEGWTLVEGAIRHADPLVREAAALTLERSGRPLDPLLAMLNQQPPEPKLVLIACRAVGDRGRTLDHARRLVAHPPAGDELKQVWQDALSSWAGRADPADVDALLGAAELTPALRERMAGQSLVRTDLPAPARVTLLKLRAAAREVQGDLTGAGRDWDELQALVQPDDRGPALKERVRLRLAAQKPGEAAEVFRKALAGGLELNGAQEALGLLLARLTELAQANDRDGMLAIAKPLREALPDGSADRGRLDALAGDTDRVVTPPVP